MAILILSVAQMSLVVSVSYGQADDAPIIRDKAEDAFQELENEKLTLRFINAVNGEYIEGGNVTIGDKKFTSDYEGKVRFKTPVENGNLPVVFTKDGYITSKFDIRIMLGTIFLNRISISPDLRPESVRIVLDWSVSPRDLDAHLIKEGAYHISYRDKTMSEDGLARLDRDDTNGNGPETITIDELSLEDTYTFAVHDYSNRNNSGSAQLANKSRATVRIYGDNRLRGVFIIDKHQKGAKWTVFKIDKGRFTQIDRVE